MLLTSKNGLTVELPDKEYQHLKEMYDARTKERILTIAGRVLSHRRLLNKFNNQHISAQDQKKIMKLAARMKQADMIAEELIARGFENHVMRAKAGRGVPESYYREINRIKHDLKEKLDNAVPADYEINTAKNLLGFLSDTDKIWSEGIVEGNNWIITAPEKWGQPK